MSKKATWLDGIAATQQRDSQGEILSIEGADITDLQNKGRFCDNHGSGFFNSLGRVTEAKKIMKAEDCDNDRQRHFWDVVKSPYIYVKGYLYDDDDSSHPNAKAAGAILRNLHKADCPLKIKASVEGGTVARGIKDPSLLARTKIHSVALTFCPANHATVMEPLNINKSEDFEQDEVLIKSVLHLAKTDVPSFRHVARVASAEKIANNINLLNDLTQKMDIPRTFPSIDTGSIISNILSSKVAKNVERIGEMVKDYVQKALTAGYGGAGAPTSRTGGAVLQSESVEPKMRYVACNKCGKEQVFMKYQVKCRECGDAFPMETIKKMIVD